ncbi:MAG: SPOR domain-containing protein [Flavobacteriales bacterium]
MALERDIHSLLFAHDCVIVPGFGGFLTHYRPARLDERRELVHPPGKDVSFNRHLVRTDGLLADEVAKREGLDHAGASRWVEQEVEGWKTRLDREGRLELGRIGTFFRDAEHNLQFDPDKRVNFLKDAYGLRAVPAVPVVVPAVASDTTPIIPLPQATMATEPAPGRASRLAIAAAVSALLFTAATWWVVSSDGPHDVQWSGFDLFSSSEPRTYSGPPAIPKPVDLSDTVHWSVPAGLHGVHSFPVAGNASPYVAVDLGPAPERVAVPESTAVAMPTPVARTRYHIVGGCFLQKENAEKFIADLQARGFAASLIDRKGGLYRVAYGSYPQRGMAEEALNAVRKEEAPAAWLLVQ